MPDIPKNLVGGGVNKEHFNFGEFSIDRFDEVNLENSKLHEHVYMDRLKKYNLISQNFVTKCDNIPLIEAKYESDFNYNVSIDVINTDYLNSFFETFDTFDLYAIYITDRYDKHLDSNFVRKITYNKSAIIVRKLDLNFFMDINYNNRGNLATPFFFRTGNFNDLEIENILQKCLYEKEIKIGSFKKSLITLNILKVLEKIEIRSIIKFYTNKSENFIESILKLQHNTLNMDTEYVSKVEISINS